MGRGPGRTQLVGHSEELGLHLHGVQQQHGAADTGLARDPATHLLPASAWLSEAWVSSQPREPRGLKGPSSKRKVHGLLLRAF